MLQIPWSSKCHGLVVFAVFPELQDKSTISKKSHSTSLLCVYLITNASSQHPQQKWVMNTPITPKTTPIYYEMMTYDPQKKSHKFIPGWYRFLFLFCVGSFKPESCLAHWDFELYSEGNLTLPAIHLSRWQLPIGFPSFHRLFRCVEMIALQHDTHGIHIVSHTCIWKHAHTNTYCHASKGKAHRLVWSL